MRTRSKVLLIGISVVAILALVFAKLFAFMDYGIVQEKYSSYSEAINKEAIIHGMAPDFLPGSATDIVAERNIDLNTLIVEFSFGDDFDEFLSMQKKSNMALPAEALEKTAIRAVDMSQLQVFSNPRPVQACVSHLVIDMQKRRAVYVYNVAPHRTGCK